MKRQYTKISAHSENHALIYDDWMHLPQKNESFCDTVKVDIFARLIFRARQSEVYFACF